MRLASTFARQAVDLRCCDKKPRWFLLDKPRLCSTNLGLLCSTSLDFARQSLGLCLDRPRLCSTGLDFARLCLDTASTFSTSLDFARNPRLFLDSLDVARQSSTSLDKPRLASTLLDKPRLAEQSLDLLDKASTLPTRLAFARQARRLLRHVALLDNPRLCSTSLDFASTSLDFASTMKSLTLCYDKPRFARLPRLCSTSLGRGSEMPRLGSY